MEAKSNQKVLITGAHGFIGRNLIARISTEYPSIEIVTAGRDDRKNISSLVKGVDFIYHLAGENRPEDDAAFKETNLNFTIELITKLKKHGQSTPILFTSSTQAELPNPYGESKRAAEEALQNYSQETGAPVYIYRLTNVFGKWARPNYNSVVATFCHNLAHQLPISINDPSREVKLVYVDDVTTAFVTHLNDPALEAQTIPSTTVTLGKLAETLTSYIASRETRITPDLSLSFNKALYGTLTSYYDTSELAIAPEMFTDDRGWLFELSKSTTAGQIFISSTNPGYTRGDHWHHTKVEKFCVIKGEGVLRLRLFGSDEIISYPLSGDKIKIVDIPTGYIHSIENETNDTMLMVIWASEILDKSKPDTYYEKVRL